ncbi:MAG: Mur ligase family protein [candidate division WOR-3 bacterium]
MKQSPQDFLYSLIDYEKTVGYDYDLDAYRNFLVQLDSPHKKLKNVILIAGTKGKGSTAAILNSCLIGCGYKVGLYSSPHLEKVNERIKVNRQNITDTELAGYLSAVKPFITKGKRARSFFETLTTIAFLHFLKTRVDFSILEVGLGGRLDATNATEPLISVITRIGYDHTNLLGTTLSQISGEKAEIIRESGNLVTIHQKPEVEKIITRIVQERKSTIIYAEEQHNIAVTDQSLKGSHVRITGGIGELDAFLPLAGKHQIENLLLAAAVLFELRTMGFLLDREAIATGIGRTRLHGRFEVISESPLVIFDCAHNEDSFRALEENLEAFGIEEFSLIFGANEDKDISYCLERIFPKASNVFLVKSNSPRAREPQELRQSARKFQNRVFISHSVKEAMQDAVSKGGPCTATIITGSFYLWQRDWKTD